jgi:hypothetical protein
MPSNAIWIDAPALPISWHHGWWFGCDIDQNDKTNHCILVAAADPLNGGPQQDRIVYSGSYLPCKASMPIPVTQLELKPPRDSFNMWIQRPGSPYEDRSAPIGLLISGDILVPADSLSKCDEELTKINKFEQ